MKKQILFKGVATALITPFKNNKVDLLGIDKIIAKQLESKINALVLFGTTGEGISLSEGEKKLIYFTVREIINDKVPIICCTSNPVTANACLNVKNYAVWGADGVLAITPYYYRCTSEGVLNHYKKLCECYLPIIVYNVPTRTNYDLCDRYDVVNGLEQMPNIIAVKQATSLTKSLDFLLNSALNVYSGNDENSFELLKKGALGSISVISNAFSEFVTMHDLAINGDLNGAKKINDKLTNIYSTLSIKPNPIVIKYVMSKLFGFENSLRLPLTTLNERDAKFVNIAIGDRL